MTITAIIPAHNEAHQIAGTIRALREQTLAPDRIVVAADNCADDTTQVARAAGADVIETISNTARKAGALNQALATVRDGDLVLVVDADTTLAPRFVEAANSMLAHDPRLGAVGGIFHGDHPRGWLELMQRIEYARYAHEVSQTRRVMVLTGTAALIRRAALDDVHQARLNGTLPGAGTYDETAITEDNELTLALRTLGWGLASPDACQVTTELMPTARDLHRQRVRWYRGALDNLSDYGWTAVTRRYWRQQAMLAVALVGMALWLGLLAVDVASGTGWSVTPWLAVPALFGAAQTVACWSRATPRERLLSALVAPDVAYSLLLQVAFLAALTGHLTSTTPTWHHATPTTQET